MPRPKTKLSRKEELAKSKQIRFEQFLKKQSNLTSDQLELLRAAFEAGWEANNKYRVNNVQPEFVHNPTANAKGDW